MTRLKNCINMCATIGNLPSSYIDSLSYEEQILWLCKFLKEQVLPSLEYMENYFENLNVQEEVNKKLEEMAESGELEEIITAYINLKSILCFDTVAEMKLSDKLINGSFVSTLGYHSINDGGNSTYKIREVTTQDVIDEMLIIAVLDTSLVAELVIQYPINPLCLGAYGDGVHDDYTYLQKAINIGNMTITKGNYYITQTIDVNGNRTIDGGSKSIIPASNIYALKIDTKSQVNIKNLYINCETNEGSNGIYSKNSYFVYFDSVNIFKLKGENTIGFNIESGFNIRINNSRVLGTKETNQYGVYIHGTQNITNVKLDTVLLQVLDKGIYCDFSTSANTNTFENIGFSNCNYCIDINGWADPISMSNIRIENSDIGIRVTGNINSSITNINCWNTLKPIVNNGTIGREMSINGASSFTGSTGTKKPVFNVVSQPINIYGSFYCQSNEYEYVTGDTTYNNDIIGVNTNISNNRVITITSDSFSASGIDKGIYKLNNTISNIYGRPNAELYVYTETDNVALKGSSQSSTALFSQAITLEKNKIYHLKFLSGNKYTVIQ